MSTKRRFWLNACTNSIRSILLVGRPIRRQAGRRLSSRMGNMTPLASRLFRSGDEATQRQLAAAQFFECTALTPMALEMRKADSSDSGFSTNARLPAPKTLIEAMIRGKRIAFFCQQMDQGNVSVHSIAEDGNGKAHVAWEATFMPGTDEFSYGNETSPSEARQASTFAGLTLIEKFLCIINQPGLVDLRGNDTDKRVMREAKTKGIKPPPARWHQCHIRPGVHGAGTDGVGSHREHPLHYVRKHMKPSLGPDRWIDGYWRGNADLGIHLKSYVAHPPKR